MTIRVLHVITALGRGGAERQLVNLVRNTDRAEFEHVVCYLHPPSDFAAELEEAGHEVICLNLPRKWPWLFAPARLVPYLRARRPDLVQTWLFDADVSARLSTLIGPRIPIINTLHWPTYDPDTIRAVNWSPRKLAGLRWLDKLTALWAQPLFVAVSESVKQSAVRYMSVPEARIRVIYNSIDPSTLLCAPDEPGRLRRALQIPKTGFVYVNVGRLASQKGQPVLLHAFKQVVAAWPDAYLAFVGEGPAADELGALARELQLDERVKFLGRRTDVGACLEMADAFVFPSLFEGLPLAPIEAMLKGLPCVASRIGPMLEVIEDGRTGLLVTPGSVAELAAAMMNLYRDPARRIQLGASGREAATRRFDNEAAMARWAGLYRELVRRRA